MHIVKKHKRQQLKPLSFIQKILLSSPFIIVVFLLMYFLTDPPFHRDFMKTMIILIVILSIIGKMIDAQSLNIDDYSPKEINKCAVLSKLKKLNRSIPQLRESFEFQKVKCENFECVIIPSLKISNYCLNSNQESWDSTWINCLETGSGWTDYLLVEDFNGRRLIVDITFGDEKDLSVFWIEGRPSWKSYEASQPILNHAATNYSKRKMANSLVFIHGLAFIYRNDKLFELKLNLMEVSGVPEKLADAFN